MTHKLTKTEQQIQKKILNQTYFKTIISIIFANLIGIIAIKSTFALTYYYEASSNEIKTQNIAGNVQDNASQTQNVNAQITTNPNPNQNANANASTQANTNASTNATNTTNLNETPRTNKKRRIKGKAQAPIKYTLPSGERVGIVLNVAQRRLYYFHPNQSLVSIFPVAVGKAGWSTPQGETTIVAMEKNPAWRPPPSIHREARARGRRLPLVVPPGPHNPLGRYAIRLGIPGILIHGTNQPWSIGRRASHGCIRMLPKNIEQLFKWVQIGTPVRIISEP